MKIIVSDVDLDIEENDDLIIIQNNEKIRPCVGCFACWVNGEDKCVIKDDFNDIAKKFSECDELILVSECLYGEFSPFVKRVYDRSISYVQPKFHVRNGKMHHKRKFTNIISVRAFLYGENLTIDEKNTMAEMLRANANNFEAILQSYDFFKNSEQALEALNEYCNY